MSSETSKTSGAEVGTSDVIGWICPGLSAAT